MPLTPGTRIGEYEVLAMLGAGGMGEVYRARDTRLFRDVALKLLPSDKTREPVMLWRLQREARIVAKLNHTNIASLPRLLSAITIFPEKLFSATPLSVSVMHSATAAMGK